MCLNYCYHIYQNLSNFTSVFKCYLKNVSWLHFSWATLYIAVALNPLLVCGFQYGMGIVCAKAFVMFSDLTVCFRHVPGPVVTWCSTRLRRTSERLIRPGRPLSDPVCLRDGRRQRSQRPVAARGRWEGRRRSVEGARPPHWGISRWIRSTGENNATRFHVFLFSTNGTRQAWKTEYTENYCFSMSSTHCLNHLFCSLAVLDSMVGPTVDVLSPFISVLCHSD